MYKKGNAFGIPVSTDDVAITPNGTIEIKNPELSKKLKGKKVQDAFSTEILNVGCPNSSIICL